MIANYHAHTPRCNHAQGEETEYVQAAIDGNLQILGFSDHTPQFFPGEHYSRMRMRPWLLQEYIDSVLALKTQYADRLQIHLGLEVEYYPSLFGRLMEFIKDSPIEYLLLGQHWNQDEEGQPYNGRLTEDVGQLEQYCNQVIDGIYTGRFTYVAHPDLLYFAGDPKVYAQHMRRLCQAAKNCSIPLEINLLGLRDSRNYPVPLFWEQAAAEGCSVLLGSDAHTPADVVSPQAEAAAMQLVRKYDLKLLQAVPLIAP